LISSRPETDPFAPEEAKVTEEVLIQTSLVIVLRIGGFLIHTTPKHPLYAMDKGWICAEERRLALF
jgi:hypothetical protein